MSPIQASFAVTLWFDSIFCWGMKMITRLMYQLCPSWSFSRPYIYMPNFLLLKGEEDKETAERKLSCESEKTVSIRNFEWSVVPELSHSCGTNLSHCFNSFIIVLICLLFISSLHGYASLSNSFHSISNDWYICRHVILELIWCLYDICSVDTNTYMSLPWSWFRLIPVMIILCYTCRYMIISIIPCVWFWFNCDLTSMLNSCGIVHGLYSFRNFGS